MSTLNPGVALRIPALALDLKKGLPQLAWGRESQGLKLVYAMGERRIEKGRGQQWLEVLRKPFCLEVKVLQKRTQDSKS